MLQSRSGGKFSVVQAMVLVATIAPGLALMRSLPAYLTTSEDFQVFHRLTAIPGGGSTSSGWARTSPGTRFFKIPGRPLASRPSYWLGHIPYWAGPCLVSLSLATAVLAILRPGPRPGPLADSPGSCTGLAVAVAMAAQAIREKRFDVIILNSWSIFWSYHEAFACHFWIALPGLAGYSVAIWWLAMALGGRWNREPGAGGSLGRALGWCWIAMALSSEVGAWCQCLNY